MTRTTKGHTGAALALVAALLLYLGVAPAGGSRKAPLAFTDINPRSATYGTSLDLDVLPAKRGVVLRFMASWCEVCRQELPDLQQLHAARGAPIVFVAADEYGPPDSLLIVAERNQLSAPILFVPEARTAELAERFDYEVLPATWVIDRKGKVRMAHEGPLAIERLVREMESGLGG
jgi:thiol-disulfide isomerase/thioredoxin